MPIFCHHHSPADLARALEAPAEAASRPSDQADQRWRRSEKECSDRARRAADRSARSTRRQHAPRTSLSAPPRQRCGKPDWKFASTIVALRFTCMIPPDLYGICLFVISLAPLGCRSTMLCFVFRCMYVTWMQLIEKRLCSFWQGRIIMFLERASKS